MLKIKKKMDYLVDDFVTMGYTISEEGEKSVKVIDKKIWWSRITYSNIYFLLLDLWDS